jgi:hypothetical protein
VLHSTENIGQVVNNFARPCLIIFIKIMTPVSELYQRLFLLHYIINVLFCLPFFIIRNVPTLNNLLELSLEVLAESKFFIYTTLRKQVSMIFNLIK